jgi:hypothetical protein
MGWTNISSKCLLYIYINQHAFILLVNIVFMYFFCSEFHKQCWKLRGQPASKQVERMRRDGINGGPNFLSWF